jgi:hypothetical protein
MFNQAFHTTQTRGPNKDFCFCGDIHRCLATTGNLEGKHPTKHRHLPSRDLMPRMQGQSGVMHALDLLMLCQKASDFHCIFRVCAHPPRHRAHSAQNQPAIKRGGDSATAILNAANALKEFGVDLCDDNSTSHVAMAPKVFCRGMQNQVWAEIEWAL